MKTNFNLESYFASLENERFSGANGDFDDFDNATGDLDLNMDGDYDNANGIGSTAQSPQPYQITIQNTTAGTLTATMWGFNLYVNSTNFNNNVGLVFTVPTNTTYQQMLSQSATQPFETSVIRISSSNTSQVIQTIAMTESSGNADLASSNIFTEQYQSEFAQNQTILTVNKRISINGNVYLQVPVLATTTVTYSFYPQVMINGTRVIGGKSATKIYGAPPVAGIAPMFTSKGGSRQRRMIDPRNR